MGNTVKLDAGDRLDVLELYARYVLVIDELEASAFAGLFTDDALFDVNGDEFRGAEAITAWYEAYAGNAGPRVRHFTTNVGIEAVDADTVTGRAYFQVWDRSRDAITLVGSYLDKITRTSEGWRFAERVVRIDERGAA